MRSIKITLMLSLITLTTLYAQIPNASFENWSGGAPAGWQTNNAVAYNLICVLQSSDASAGSSSAKITVSSYNGIEMGPLLSSGFTVSEKILNMSGYYKFSPVQNDILSIAVTVSKNGTVIGDGLLDITTASSTYKQFKIGINYGINSTPDECKIFFVIGSKDNQTSAHTGSYALIDNLSFNNLGSSVAIDSSVPDNFSLQQNYPNPFNPTTTINYSIAREGFVTLKVYDALGREAASLINENKPVGNYKIDFNAGGLSNGIYFYQLKTADFVQTRKMILLK